MAAFRADRLRDAMEEQFLSQAELARAMGVPERTIWRWWQGGTNPRRAHVRRLADALERDPHWFYEPEREAA